MLVGIDEVGRGCWAGPLVVGAVILDKPIIGLRDSKKLTKFRRDKLAAEIYLKARAVGLGWVSPAEIDEFGLTKSISLAIKYALAKIEIDFNEIIIDGNYNFLPDDPRVRVVIKADDSVPAVSAASIVAKVARDKYMQQQALIFPDYHFEKHVGYGTKNHLESLLLHGVCSLHRRSFKPIQSLLN